MRYTWRSTGRIAIGVIIVFWSLGPILWAVNMSLTTEAGIDKARPSLLPSPFTWSHYSQLLNGSGESSTNFQLALRNSFIQAGGATVITVAIALFAGYAFARWRFAGARVMFFAIIGMLSVPLLAVLLPLFRISSTLDLINTQIPIIVLGVTTSLPIAVWIMRSFVAALPADLEAAARLDGAGEIRLLWRIILPLLRPAIAAVAIIVFLTSWSAFLVPLLFSQTIATTPLTVLIPNYVTKAGAEYGLQSAASCLAMIPPLLLVFALNRFLVSGLLRGAFR